MANELEILPYDGENDDNLGRVDEQQDEEMKATAYANNTFAFNEEKL